ncbi:MAG: hypothetical protein ACUVTL_03230 [Thermoproteota archaeon]
MVEFSQKDGKTLGIDVLSFEETIEADDKREEVSYTRRCRNRLRESFP